MICDFQCFANIVAKHRCLKKKKKDKMRLMNEKTRKDMIKNHFCETHKFFIFRQIFVQFQIV